MLRPAALSLALLALSASAAAADVVTGNVLDGSTLKPVAKATLTVAGTTVTTDRVGGFKLDLPPGATTLAVTAAGYDSAAEELTVPEGGMTD